MIEIAVEKLKEWLVAGESETLEFKENFGEETLEAIGAFANARGGVLLIGVRDDTEICGYQIGKKTLEDIANRIQEATDPRLQPSLSIIPFEKKNVIVIQVPVSTGMPVSVRGRYFRRVGKTVQRMSHEEIMQRMVATTGLSWDATLEPSATLNDLDSERLNLFFQTVKKSGRKPMPEQTSPEEFLRKIELIKNGSPTRAALLLFGKSPGSFFSSAFLKIGRFRSPTQIVDDREAHGNLFDQLDNAMGWFRERLETTFAFKGEPQREVKWEYPLNAIREALVNVLCHRDYTSHAHSQIRLYDDQLEFWNAGGLPASLTLETLFLEHDSIPRNRKIAEAFFYAGLIERWGSGTLRMAEELANNKFPPPKFESEGGRFRVIFYKEIQTKEYLKKLGLTDRQIRVITYVKEQGTVTNAQYQKIAEVSERTATRELNDLKSKGILISEGKHGRGVIYKLKAP